jgi:hypothetical protein
VDERTLRRDQWLMAGIAAAISTIAFYHYRHQLLLYGDAVAHIGIARRVVDSLTPGLGQLGTVWLPLPHLLLLPFVVSTRMWQSGAAASIPAMVAHVLAAAGLLRLVGSSLTRAQLHPDVARGAAWISTLAFAGNPNLLYLQATAMTEPLYLALFVWALVYLGDFASAPAENKGALFRCGLLLAAAELTRYDGWWAATWTVAVAVGVTIWAARHAEPAARSALARRLAVFALIVAAAPALWMAWNWKNYGNALEFANGPYSARAIEKRTGDGTAYPGRDSIVAAAGVYRRAVQLNLGEGRWGRALYWTAVAGALFLLLLVATRTVPLRAALPLFLLWMPRGFYALSIAYGSVPIFTPYDWPFSYYNLRYGLAMLPAVSASAVLLFALVAFGFQWRAPRTVLLAAAALLIAFAWVSCWKWPDRPKSLLPAEPLRGPVVWREAVVNARTRQMLEERLAAALSALPPGSRLLMFTGASVGALQRAGIPLRRTINEGNYRLWQAALLAPVRSSADYVVATDGDAVAAAVARYPDGLQAAAVIESEARPRTVIYRVIAH